MFTSKKREFTPLPLPDRFDLTDSEMRMQALTFMNHMCKRHTVRDYSDRAVDLGVIEDCIAAAGTAPSGANHQPWHFVAIKDADMKTRVRKAAEEEEETFYDGGAGAEWLRALEPIGTDKHKPHLTDAPWLIVVFAQRYGTTDAGERFKNYYVPESVGIATGILITALHTAGLVSLTHTPNPMKFLGEMCGRPASDKPTMIIAVGHPHKDATVPEVAKIKKPLSEIMTVL